MHGSMSLCQRQCLGYDKHEVLQCFHPSPSASVIDETPVLLASSHRIMHMIDPDQAKSADLCVHVLACQVSQICLGEFAEN